MTEPKHTLKKRSLEELDDVIEEIIERNPEWAAEIERIIEAERNEQNVGNLGTAPARYKVAL